MNILALLSMDIPASGAPNAGAVFRNVDRGANEARNLLSGGRRAARAAITREGLTQSISLELGRDLYAGQSEASALAS
jgi:hypothetical protein